MTIMAPLYIMMLVSGLSIVHSEHSNLQTDSKRQTDTDVLRTMYMLQEKVQVLEKEIRRLKAGQQQGGTLPTVAFYARMDQPNINMVFNQTVTFPEVVTNQGGGHDQNTSVFTAPMGGVYHFTMDLMGFWQENLEVGMVKNDLNAALVFVGSGSMYGVGTRSAILKLDAGDDVWVKIPSSVYNDGNIRLYGRGWSTFSGFLIGQL